MTSRQPASRFRRASWAIGLGAVSSLGTVSWWYQADFQIESSHGVGCTISKDFLYTPNNVLQGGFPSNAEACSALGRQLSMCLTIDARTARNCRDSEPKEINQALEATVQRPILVPWTVSNQSRYFRWAPSWIDSFLSIFARGGKKCGEIGTEEIPALRVVEGVDAVCLATFVDERSALTAAHCVMGTGSAASTPVDFRCTDSATTITGRCYSPWKGPNDDKHDIARCVFEKAVSSGCRGSTQQAQLTRPDLTQLNAISVLVEGDGCTKLDDGSVKDWPQQDAKPLTAVKASMPGLRVEGGDSGGIVLAQISGSGRMVVGVNVRPGFRATNFASSWVDPCLWREQPTCVKK